MNQPSSTPSLKGRALRLLSRREYSRAELMKKLTEFETESGELVRVLDELERKNFINETRVIESLLNSKASKFGLLRMKQELREKQLSGEASQLAMSQAIESLQMSELERAQAVWRKKFSTPPQTRQETAKQQRFLASRGFAQDIVWRVIQGKNEHDD
jgi:regulatory protein